MLKLEKNFQNLTLNSFPLKLALVCILLLIVGLGSFMTFNNKLSQKDLLLFLFTPTVVLSLLKHRHLEMSKPRNTVRLVARSLLRKQITQFGLDEIERVELLKTKGATASNHAIQILLKSNKYILITSSDIIGTNKKLKNYHEEINQWLLD
ncbi:hypothetical protein M902_3257 [Bacteriovorax sp. BAL6_X]|uniref:hypothetical protein n=1 Tax=Bacteriovorax sp. BAL6_X TaxID=1201290 RepID=UPI000385BC33|nr:hypothetical protein [Bacteriovorax sp. BAL6_X]EPZ50792.1 hypothetical protein M902_3257 [Bacteriovorax sp. BAL6_X]